MWEELSRRCDTDQGGEEEFDLVPPEYMIFVAEIQGMQDGKKLYCTTCWAPFMPEVYAFDVTTESIYEYLVDLESEDNGMLEKIRMGGLVRAETDENYEGPFAEQFRIMIRMINELAAENGIRTETYDSSDDLDDM